MTCAQQRHIKAQEFSRLCDAVADSRSRHHAIYFGERKLDLGSVAAATSWTRLSNEGGELLLAVKARFLSRLLFLHPAT